MNEAERSTPLDVRRRKLKFRSWHRGIREMDLIMGRFADACLDALSEAELDDYERLLDVPDQQFFAWMNGTEPVSAECDLPIFRKLVKFYDEQPRAPDAGAGNAGS
jgi:antitoxin CptB